MYLVVILVIAKIVRKKKIETQFLFSSSMYQKSPPKQYLYLFFVRKMSLIDTN